jgi:GTP cyclohydrolase I
MKLKTVGIEDIRSPIHVREQSGSRQETVASITLRADLPKNVRSSCLTTFLDILEAYQDDMRVDRVPALLAAVKNELQAESAHITLKFPYFIEKRAPVTGTASLMEYTAQFACGSAGTPDMVVSVWVPSTTLCPCSKEISEAGAHNQRAEINLNVKFRGFIWIEDLIRMAEQGASCEVFSLLKRPDEKHVTEQAYRNPMFVEDVVRKVAGLAMAHPDITWFSVGVESFESIHKHSAYAFVESGSL